MACCCPPPFDRSHCQGCRRNTIKAGFKSVPDRMDKNEESRKGKEKDGEASNQETKNEIEDRPSNTV